MLTKLTAQSHSPITYGAAALVAHALHPAVHEASQMLVEIFLFAFVKAYLLPLGLLRLIPTI